jgi:hypothetical protein
MDNMQVKFVITIIFQKTTKDYFYQITFSK